MSIFHMSLSDFNDYTPIEIDNALKAYYKEETENNKLTWEQLRIQIYYSYLLTASTKSKVSYTSFKHEYMPFEFDKDTHEEKPVIDDNTIDMIQNYFNKNKEPE
jgi:nucleoside-specific outer membrane channel protein Tsx